MKRRKAYTVIISPSNLKPVIRFTIHRATLWVLFFSFVILASYGILGSIKFYEENKLYADYIKIKKENSELAEANKIITQLREKEQLIRKFLGLEADSGLEPGQGGPSPTGLGFDEEEMKPATKAAYSLTDSFTLSVDKLPPSKEAILLDLDLQEMIDFLENQRIELAKLPTISPIAAVDSWITSGFGIRKSPFTGLREFHSGLDIFAV